MAGGNYGNYNTTGVLKGPSGPSAVKAEEASPEIVVTAQQLSKLDALQMLLDVIGLVPGFGAPADILNAIISGARGDWLGAALSLFGAVPVAGEAATAGKIAKNADRYAAAVAKVADEVLPHLPASVQAQLGPAIEAAKKKIDELGARSRSRRPRPSRRARMGRRSRAPAATAACASTRKAAAQGRRHTMSCRTCLPNDAIRVLPGRHLACRRLHDLR
jgi:hypothetical protein